MSLSDVASIIIIAEAYQKSAGKITKRKEDYKEVGAWETKEAFSSNRFSEKK